jgi:hypothetical protein
VGAEVGSELGRRAGRREHAVEGAELVAAAAAGDGFNTGDDRRARNDAWVVVSGRRQCCEL